MRRTTTSLSHPRAGPGMATWPTGRCSPRTQKREKSALAAQWQCRLLTIETQNSNVAACRFYAREGRQLRAIHPAAYADFPDEIQLLWNLEL
jgi:hypothetical protein